MPSRAPFLATLLLTALLPIAAMGAPTSSLEQGEAMLQGLAGLPSRQYLDTIGRDPEAAARLVTTIFTHWSEQPGYQARAFVDLGHLQALLGQYQEAEASFVSAVAAAPDLKAAQMGLVEARARIRAATSAQPSLPYGNQLLRAEPFPVASADDLWVVLSATVRQGKPLTRYANVTIQVFHDSGTEFHELASDRVPGPGLDSEPVHSIAFHLRDLTGDGRAEIVVCTSRMDLSSRPSRIQAYANSPPPLKAILSQPSGSPIWIESLNRSQSYNVGITHAIGWNVPPAEKPRWTDIYAWSSRAGSFQVANARFPLSFREWPARLQKVLARCPDDWQILQHLALAQQLTGHSPDATSSYRRALTQAERVTRASITAGQKAFVEEQIRGMRKQLESLQEPRSR